ncbi:MAG TPA: TylF/MycF/NovP-related O-methyltransferase [Thermoanaerobaculia bacterium]|nr:TylF/MycF/NovP-related O-methyltransferase [Thermoanaerobaculia bacterium]
MKSLERVERVEIRKGWFQDTLPSAKHEIGSIAVLRLDGDWYESTRVCLDNLYDLVAPGGYVIIDDYNYWEGCKRAVDEFLAARGLGVALVAVGDSAVWWEVPC